MPRYIDAEPLYQKINAWRKQIKLNYGEYDDYVECLGEVLTIIGSEPNADLTSEYMKHYRQGLHDAELKRNGELMQTFDPD